MYTVKYSSLILSDILTLTWQCVVIAGSLDMAVDSQDTPLQPARHRPKVGTPLQQARLRPLVVTLQPRVATQEEPLPQVLLAGTPPWWTRDLLVSLYIKLFKYTAIVILYACVGANFRTHIAVFSPSQIVLPM